MKNKWLIIIIILFALQGIGWKTFNDNWLSEKNRDYTLFFTSSDKSNTKEYKVFFENGLNSVKTFFKTPFNKKFSIYIHPARYSLDSLWRKDWNTPTFKSECWMVASGVANKLDILSPVAWEKESCEHNYSDKKNTQKLVTHELIHVFHGQQNISPDFSNTESIDWFVEGLATYASGQCDSLRLNEVKKAIINGETPKSLDNFWTGKIKYGLSGSIVMYIDHKYGRTKLKELLPYNKKSEILSALKVSENELLEGWKNYLKNL